MDTIGCPCMQGWPLPELTKVYVMPSTSGTKGAHWEKDGGHAAWRALAKDVRALDASCEWPIAKCH